MSRFKYFLKEGFKNIWVNWIMSIATISVLSLCLLLLGTSMLISANAKNLIKEVEGTNQIAVYLNSGFDQPAMNAIGQKIKELPNVDTVLFISKEDVLISQQKEMDQYAELLAGYENDNPFPDTYQVSLKNMDDFASTAKLIQKIDGVKSTTQFVEIAQKLSAISKVINVVGIWLFVILAVVSLFIVSNTIKSAVFVRKREINIMKFVGATDSFINWPFVIEGVFIGIFSAILSIFAEWYIYTWLIVKVFDVFKIVNPISYKSIMWYIIGGFSISGVVVGVSGSLISVRKYLKV